MMFCTIFFQALSLITVLCLKKSCLKQNGVYNALYIGLYVLIAIVTPSKGELNCGNLTLEYLCHSNHVDAKITLIPNDVIIVSIKEGSYFWWYHLNEQWVLLSHENNPQKYDEKNLTIIIHNLQNSDAGLYTLGCSHERNTYRSRNYVSLVNKDGRDIGCDTSTSTVTSQTTTEFVLNGTLNTARVAETPTSELFTSTVIYVLAICSVIIVLVLAGTVIFVVRKRGITHTALSRLASHEDGSTVNLHLDTDPCTSSGTRSSNIYNEIEPKKCKGGKDKFNISKQSLLSFQNSPALPRRPSNVKPIKFDTEVEYDMITEDTKYSKSKDNPVPGTSKISESSDNDYASIVPKEDSLQRVKTSKAINNNDFPEYSTVSKRPVYAKVQKRKESAITDTSKHSIGTRQNEATYMNNYNVVFPAFDYANVVTKLENNEIETLEVDEPVKYCNLAAKRRSERKASNKSLKYAVLDHTGCDAYLKEQNCGPYDLPEFVKLVNCQYASIDFNKKAFVAPIRKAPSSWYKQNRKQKKKL